MKLKSKSARIFAVIGVAVLFIALVVGFLLLLNYIDMSKDQNSDSADTPANTNVVYIDGVGYTKKSGISTVLFIGVDKYEDEMYGEIVNNQQADFLTLLVIDSDKQEYTPVQINRDTMTSVTSYGLHGEETGSNYEQIALSYTYGSGGNDSCRHTASAVSSLLYDTDIDDYISVGLDAIPILNDSVGGVTLTVLDDLSSFDSTLIKGDTVTLNGDTATLYVRSRYGLEDSTNLNRMKRQQQYMNTWLSLAKEKQAENANFAADTVLSINDYFYSDMTTNRLSTLAKTLSEYKQNDIIELDGESSVVDNHTQFTLNEESLKTFIIDHFYDEVE